MRAKTAVVFVFAMLNCGCASTVSSLSTSTIQVADQRFIPGHEYEVDTVRQTDSAKISYLGRIVDVDDKFVRFDGALKRVETTQSPRIPIVGKWFRNRAVGMIDLKGRVQVSRDQITSIRNRGAAPKPSIFDEAH